MKTAMLTHTKEPKQRWILLADREIVIDTGSSVQMLKALKRLKVAIPDVLCGPDCWNTDYCLQWNSKAGLWEHKEVA